MILNIASIDILFKNDFKSNLKFQKNQNTSEQYRHCVGNSPTAFSAARFRTQRSHEISQRQFGQLETSSFRRASASKWPRHVAHMRCPFLHLTFWDEIFEPFLINYILKRFYPMVLSFNFDIK